MIGREKPGEQSEVAQLIQQTLEQERWQREMMEQRYKQYMDDEEEVHAKPQNKFTQTHTKLSKIRQFSFSGVCSQHPQLSCFISLWILSAAGNQKQED